MKVEISSTNRIGISQEILAVFASLHWDILAVEVYPSLTYVNINAINTSLKAVTDSLADIKGIITCHQIELLPTEKREKHLQALLNRIPDPIIDIDERGKVLAINQSALQHVFDSNKKIEGQLISQFIGKEHDLLLTNKAMSCTLTIKNQSYLAEVSPIFSGGKSAYPNKVNDHVSGAVIILKTMNALGRQVSLMQSPKEQGVESIIGKSAKVRMLIAQTLRYAELDLPVLISGETGTGKELVARSLHAASHRAKSPFLAINCAAMSEHLLESELFGYDSGAFTGAQRGGKPGLIELANGGSLFLDEIAEMSVYLQAKLLRFLQDFTYRRVGGTKELMANVRIISASHQDFSALLEQKLFREDLFYRVNVLNLDLPPLRERAEDVPLLTEVFMKNAAKQVNQAVPIISEQAMNTLIGYHWPGNIRQLQNILFRVVALDTKGVIDNNNLLEVLSHQDKARLLNNEALVHQPLSGLSAVQYQPIDEASDWAQLKSNFERNMLQSLYPHYPTTRKLAQRLKVSHNKIAMKLREHGFIKSNVRI